MAKAGVKMKNDLLKNQRLLLASLLGAVAFLVFFDLFTDSSQGVEVSHLILEGLLGLISLFGILILIRDQFALRNELSLEKEVSQRLREDNSLWKSQSRKYLDGLSQEIERQLTKWQLSKAEKEVAFLLLKGLSLKEIADVRKTVEKTARLQAAAVYEKSGLAGRSELSAFFLEDLLPPQEESTLKT